MKRMYLSFIHSFIHSFIYLFILIFFGCLNLNNQDLGNITIKVPEKKINHTFRSVPIETEHEGKTIANYVIILTSNKISTIEKNVGPGCEVEFYDLPEGDYSIFCIAESEGGTKEFGDESKTTVVSGKTTVVTLELKPLISIEYFNSKDEMIAGEIAWNGRTITILNPNTLPIQLPQKYEFDYWEDESIDGDQKYYPGDNYTYSGVVPHFKMVLKSIDSTQIGYIAYTDMTTSKNLIGNKTPIGIVVEVENGFATKIMHLQEFSKAWNKDSTLSFSTSNTENIDGYNVISLYINEGYNLDGEKSSIGVNLEALRYAEQISTENVLWYVPCQTELLKAVNTNKDIYNQVLSTIENANQIGTATDYWSCSFMTTNILAYFNKNQNGVYTSEVAISSDVFASEKTVRYFAHFEEAE